jgi:hypothetical protein
MYSVASEGLVIGVGSVDCTTVGPRQPIVVGGA